LINLSEVGQFIRSKTNTPEFRAEAVKLVLAQGLTLDDAAKRLAIPKGTSGESAAKRSNAYPSNVRRYAASAGVS
jgi:transposase-like protein